MCNLSVQDSVIDFLIYSYFGVTFENDKKEIISVAAKRGYNDATMRGALVFKKNFDKNVDASKYTSAYKKFEKEREAIRYAVKIYVVKIVSKKFEDLKECVNYNSWHKGLCDILVNTIDKKYDELLKENCNELYKLGENHKQYFTYGNAQKFVNMFLKNLYILTVISSLYKEDINAKTWYKEYKWIINKSENFHIPLDSYIGVSGWSTIDNYDKYLKKIEEYPELSFSNENEHWIKKAKEETKKNTISKLKKFSKILINNEDIRQELKNYVGSDEIK